MFGVFLTSYFTDIYAASARWCLIALSYQGRGNLVLKNPPWNENISMGFTLESRYLITYIITSSRTSKVFCSSLIAFPPQMEDHLKH